MTVLCKIFVGMFMQPHPILKRQHSSKSKKRRRLPPEFTHAKHLAHLKVFGWCKLARLHQMTSRKTSTFSDLKCDASTPLLFLQSFSVLKRKRSNTRFAFYISLILRWRTHCSILSKPKRHSNKGVISVQLSVCKKFYSELIKIAFWAQKKQGKNLLGYGLILASFIAQNVLVCNQKIA